jgi:Heterokaryon incompatibility protein (HET)
MTVQQNHNKARCPLINSKDLPTRLIDVHLKDYPEEPRLVLPTKGEKSYYLALSHCWGPRVSGERLITTKATLESWLESIPLSKMPSNFFDATIITRKLGYKYLWIDSLCIIQDSREDWETESANMGNIYSNASLTLAAAAAKDSDGGMLGLNHRSENTRAKFQISNGSLQDRVRISDQEQMTGSENAPDSKKRLQCHFKLHDHGGSSIVILEPVDLSVSEEGWTECAVYGPLARRGWCLQERLLSYRMLYYGERQIYWQCTSSRKAADGGVIPEGAGRSSSHLSLDNFPSEWPDLLGLKQLQCSPINKRTRLAQSKDWIEVEKMAYRIWRNVKVSGHISTRFAKITPKPAKMPTLIPRKSSAFLNQNNKAFRIRLIITYYYLYLNIGFLDTYFYT